MAPSRALAGAALTLLLGLLTVGCPTLDPPLIGFPGPLPTVQEDYTEVDGLTMTAFYPDTTDGAPYPLIILNTGWNQGRVAYFKYGETLAQWGYVCIIRFLSSPDGFTESNFDAQVAQVSQVIDWAAAQNADPDSPLYGRVDADTVGVTGHSLGGHVCIGAILKDPRIDAAISIDAWFDRVTDPFGDVLTTIATPTMFINAWQGRCGGHNLDNPVPIYDLIGTPKLEMAVIDSAHIDFLEVSPGINAAGQVLCGGGTRDKNEVRAIAQRYMVAWFNVYLKGLTEYTDYFAGEKAQQDINTGSVTIRSEL